MAIFDINFPSNPVLPQFREGVILDGVSYVLRFNHNGREDLWYLSLRTAEGESIVEGIKLVLDIPLFRKSADDRRPPGELMVIEDGDLDTNAGLPPDLVAIGTRAIIGYLDEEELSA